MIDIPNYLKLKQMITDTIRLHLRRDVLMLLFFLTPLATLAQTGLGSTTLDNSVRTSAAGETTYEYAETLYLGPNAVWNISGTHIIYSKFIWIAPTAVIENNSVGSIVIASPDENPYYPDMSGATTIDGNNGNPIGAVIRHQNHNNIILADIQDPGYGTVNATGPLAASLHLQNYFHFDIDGGDIILNGHDLLTSGSGNLSGYGPDRRVVTGNSIAGHLVRQNAGSSSLTYFPVGISEGDYTPAYIEGSGDYHVSVTSYAASGVPISVAQEGMDRVWHVYGGAASALGLVHNSPATDGTSFVDDDAFITRYIGSGSWSNGTPEQIGTGNHYNAFATAAGIPNLGIVDGAWVTKTSENSTPLPVRLVSFEAKSEGPSVELSWTTANERSNRHFEIERSNDGTSWQKIGLVLSNFSDGNSDVKSSYLFTDIRPWKGSNYYRLKQTDLDGKYTYSQIRTVSIEKGTDLKLYPNPAVTSIQVEGFEGKVNVTIYDASGRQMLKNENVTERQQISVSSFQPGIYSVYINNANGLTANLKFLK